MRGSTLRILGKTLPAWVVAVALIVATAGAATGVVLAGRVTGTIGATVSQALLVNGGAIVGADRQLLTLHDDGTKFTATAEVNTGDDYNVNLSLANNSDAELTGELTLMAPDGITLDVVDADDVVGDIVRTGPFTWKFRLVPTTDGVVDMLITVALADDMPPGFYSIDGTLKQVSE